MQKWEYKVIIRQRQSGFFTDNNWSVNMCDFLPEMGEEGWELVSVLPLSSEYGEGKAGFTSDEKWVFKRPKNESAG